MNRTVWLALLIMLFVVGCSHYEKNFNPEPVAPEFLPIFQSSGEVAVQGVFRGTPNKVLLLRGSGHKWYADEDELVNTAVMVTKDILKQNNVVIREDSTKVLKVSFANAKWDRGGWTTALILGFQVQAGDRFIGEFHGSHNIGHVLQMHWIIEATVTDAMIKAFQDQDVLNYLLE